MFKVIRSAYCLQAVLPVCLLMCASTGFAADQAESKTTPAAKAKSKTEMKPYTEKIVGTDGTFDMVPIAGGNFVMGSPADEKDRKPGEGPQFKVKIEPFWMGKHEVTWDEYDIWSFDLDIQRRKFAGAKPTKFDKLSDAVTRPTKPYVDMTFDMGHDGFPAICMTQLAAKTYCQWLSAKTGHYYRLPTEAEWEYACRAGTTTAYSFGDDPKKLDEYAWYYDNADDTYHKVGKKKPNPWGLYDMHGNVAEWVLDQHDEKFYSKFAKTKMAIFPLNVPTKLYPRVARGGGWDHDADVLRSAARMPSTEDWKILDPQIPQSIWYHTDALFVGFRVVRPVTVPDLKTRRKLRLEPLPEEQVEPDEIGAKK